MQISAKVGKDGTPHTCDFDFGADLDAASKLFTPEVVFANYRAAAVVALQGFIRGLIKQKKSKAEIDAAVATWKPGVRQPGKSASERAKESLLKLSAEDRAALLKEMRAELKQAG